MPVIPIDRVVDKKRKKNQKYTGSKKSSKMKTIFLVSDGERSCSIHPSFQGCQIFLHTIYQNGGNFATKLPKLPNGHKIYQMAVVYSKWP
jgi:hypothetical protein